MNEQSGQVRELLLLLVVVFLFAGNILVGKAAANALPPFTLALSRAVIALSAASLFFGRAAWRNAAALSARKTQLFIIGASGIGLFNALLYAALHTADTTTVAVLEASIPIVTAIVMWVGFGEQLGRLGWAGVMLSAAGAVIVVSNGAPLQIVANASPGVLIMLAAIAAWVVYAVTARRGLMGLPPLAAMVPLSLSAVIALVPFAIAEQIITGFTDTITPRAVVSALYLGLGPSLVAFILYNRALLTIGPTPAALSLNGLPVVVMLLGFLFLGEPITIAHIVGTGAVIAGVTVVVKTRRGGARRRAPGLEND
jgi:drug/metabolite transporter (DMT)-like permease